MKPRKRVVNIFVLILLNVSIMASLRNLPLVAELGYSALFFFVVVAIFFLIPSALVSAELATGWPKSGGIYIWAREAFGDRWGFFAIWMQWIHNVSWYPAILSFVAATIAYLFEPQLAKNKFFIFFVILFIYWGMTLINYLGIKVSSSISSIGVIFGTILPGIFIICMGLAWIGGDNPVQISLSLGNFFPDFSNIKSFVFLAGLFLAFSGLEVSAGYAGEVKNPQKNYPRAIVFSAIITFALFMLGSLSIALIIPQKDISLVSGVMEAINILLNRFQIHWLIPVFGICLIAGAIAETNSWILGPIKALATTSEHGNLPPFFKQYNRHGMPTHLLLFQAILVSIISLIFLIMPTLSTAYWILSALTAQIYLIMYLVMFMTAIRLRYKKGHIIRGYRIPHKHKGIWVVGGAGFLSSLFGILIGFIPPQQLKIGNIYIYEAFLIFSLLLMIALPLVIHRFKKHSWKK